MIIDNAVELAKLLLHDDYTIELVVGGTVEVHREERGYTVAIVGLDHQLIDEWYGTSIIRLARRLLFNYHLRVRH